MATRATPLEHGHGPAVGRNVEPYHRVEQLHAPPDLSHVWRRERDSIVDVGQALRASMELLLRSPDVHGRTLRVYLAAAVELLASYSKLDDRTTVGQIAAIARVPDDESHRNVRRELKRLDELGVLHHDGRPGQYGHSWISLRVVAAQPPLMNPVVHDPVEPVVHDPVSEKVFREELLGRAAGPVARAREPRGVAGLVGDSEPGEEPLEAGVVAGVARRHAALETHGSLARLLAMLPDADEHTPSVLHALYDPLGEGAISLACDELKIYGSRVLRPSAYVVEIAKRLHREQGSRQVSAA